MDLARCKECGHDFDSASLRDGVCDACLLYADKIRRARDRRVKEARRALDANPPLRKPTPCTRCSSTEFVRWVTQEANIAVFEVFICRGCGHTETFARDPENIPLDPFRCTELFRGGGNGGPYR
jgi:hypothetical protein